MTKMTLSFAAALLAGTMLSNAAEAGGIRVGFGFPLGSFIAHSLQSQAGRPSYQRAEPKRSTKPVVAHRKSEDDKPARKVSRPAPKKVEVAQEEPAPRKVKRAPKVQVAAEEEAPAPRKIKRTPKVEVAAQAEAPAPRKIKRVAPKIEAPEQPAEKPAAVKTASLEDKTVLSDVSPSVPVPAAPAEAFEITGTQSTPATHQTATIAPEKVKTETVTAELSSETVPAPAKPETAEKTEQKAPAVAATLPAESPKLCRRFSAAVAALIDVPCE